MKKQLEIRKAFALLYSFNFLRNQMNEREVIDNESKSGLTKIVKC